METEQLTPDRIRWVKNIKRDKGRGFAYDGLTPGDVFPLHWPRRFGGTAAKPQRGDLIVLFQNYLNNGILLTHLVEVVDDAPFEDYTNPSSNYLTARRVKLIHFSRHIRKIPDHDFRKAAYGITYRVGNLNTVKSEQQIREELWNAFQDDPAQLLKIESAPDGYTLRLPENKLCSAPQIVRAKRSMIALIGKNGSGKSSILESIFKWSQHSDLYDTICFTSGQNERYSAIFEQIQQPRIQNLLAFQRSEDVEREERFLTDKIHSFYFNKEWSRLLIFFAVVFNREGNVAGLLNEFGHSSERIKFSFTLRIDRKYVDRISKGKIKEEEFGEESEVLNSRFHRTLSRLLSTHSEEYDFDAPLDETISLDCESAMEVFDERNTNLLFNFFWTCAHQKTPFLELGEMKLWLGELELKDLSDGEYQLLSLTSLLEHFDGERTIFLLDEIDSHLYYKNIQRMWDKLRNCRGYVFTTTHISDSILCNDVEDLKLVEEGKIQEEMTFKEIAERLARLTGVREYEFKLAAGREYIALVEDIFDWRVFTGLAKVKLGERYDEEKMNKIQPIKCSSGFNDIHQTFGKEKIHWVEKFYQYNPSIPVKKVFLICDRDLLPLSNINSTNGVQVTGGLPLAQNISKYTYRLSWKRRDIENYLLSHSVLSRYGLLNGINRRFGEDDKIQAGDCCDREQIRCCDVKSDIQPLYLRDLNTLTGAESERGVDFDKLKMVINQIPPCEISEDIEKMYTFIVSKISN